MAATNLETVLCDDATALAEAVATQIADLSATGSSPLCIALSGGSTPRRLYETLATAPHRERVRWERLEIFFSDERPVPPEHPDSNFGMARRALLAHVPVRAHPMPAEAGDAHGYARLVAERVRDREHGIPGFDLILLGVGTDGHTASLFPGTAALAERRRWVVMNDVPQLQTRRMTFTYPLINAARRAWILAAGAEKAAIVEQCLRSLPAGGDPARWPVTGVRPTRGALVWWLDQAAGQRSGARSETPPP